MKQKSKISQRTEEKRGTRRRKQRIMSFVRERRKKQKHYDAVFNFENYGPGCMKWEKLEDITH